MAAAPIARPSGFSCASPAARLACRSTWTPPGVAWLTREAVSPTVSPARDAVPTTASLARVVASLTLDRAALTFPATASLARDGTSAL